MNKSIILAIPAVLSAYLPCAALAAPPIVSIRGPGNGSRFTEPATVTIYAWATDDGAVAKVEFFANGLSLGPPVIAAPPH